MAESKHQGGCHCGAVRYQVDVDPAEGGVTCNCSMCGRSGTVLAFVPVAKFSLDQGSDNLASYHFNKKHIDHQFCKTCGIKSFARGKSPDGTEMIAVNLRCLDGVDVSKLPTQAFDGASL
jgi:hypothetical protein